MLQYKERHRSSGRHATVSTAYRRALRLPALVPARRAVADPALSDATSIDEDHPESRPELGAHCAVKEEVGRAVDQHEEIENVAERHVDVVEDPQVEAAQ